MSWTMRDRIGAVLGATFVVLIFVGNAIATAGTNQNAHPTGEQVLEDVRNAAGSTSATVGFVLEVLAFVAFFGFLGYLADVFRRRGSAEPRIAAGTALVAGITMLAIKLGSATAPMVLEADRDTLSPQLAQLLNDLNGAAFVLSWLPFALFVGALAIALREAAVAGKPTAYTGAALGLVGIPLAILGLKDVVSASPVAFLLEMLWLLVVSVQLTIRPVAATPERYAHTADTRFPLTS